MMKGIEEIRDKKGEIIAVIARSGYLPPGVSFLSRPEWPLQLGVSNYLHSQVVRPHTHNRRQISVEAVQEVVHVDTGRIRVDLYDTADLLAGTADLFTGDTILFVQGGHSLQIMEDSRIIEVKQGPYEGLASDKRMLG
jgi:hypothetical protein